MSLWRRLFGGGAPEPEPTETRDSAPPEPEIELRAPDDPELILERLGDDPSARVVDAEVLAQIERLRQQGREARAIDLVRRVLAHHPERLVLHQRVAELLASRGDDEGAGRLLTPFLDSTDAPLELWMLGAEIAERRGDETGALALYERVMARDLDYPRARARVRRLREGERKQADVGATLMADGALTRGRYRVERELGRGGAGTVFLAEDLSLGRKVALKVYHRRGRSERVRLLVEARTPARLQHPGIVRVFDIDETLAAIAMERVLGGSVRQEIDKGALPAARVLRWLLTGAEALAHVHAADVVHRDIKPSNMLLRADDRVVLTDFGVACEPGHVAPSAAAEGTLKYMAPEQRAAAPADLPMDVHAFGVAAREILEHVSTERPEVLDELVGACLRVDPKRRPDARWLVETLSPLAGPLPAG
ncbi:MAG: protein kinase [Sandaracinaceae bacterium]